MEILMEIELLQRQYWRLEPINAVSIECNKRILWPMEQQTEQSLLQDQTDQ
jgi:hypothetical protein